MDNIPRPDVNLHADEYGPGANVELLRSLHHGLNRIDFLDYPRQWHFTPEQLSTGTFSQDDSHLAAAVVQNWLFFGLLEEVFQVPVPEDDFTCASETGRRSLTTRVLHKYGGEWQERCQNMSEAEKSEARERLREVFHGCFRFFRLFLQGARNQYPENFDQYLNPLAVLVETLRHWTVSVIGLGGEPDPLPSTLCPEATTTLVNRGWCPFVIGKMLFPHHSPSLFTYATFFAKCPSTLGQDHTNCTRNGCTVTNVDVSTYKARHNSRYCKEQEGIPCTTLIPDLPTVKQLLQDGQIPVLSFSEDGGLKVLPHTHQAFIAISHVWSDGLGSTSESGLPECQVKFLKNAAIAASYYIDVEEGRSDASAFDIEKGCPNEGTPFWVDSLCVPAEHDVRKKAIILMAETYATAAAVVAIDSAMLQHSLATPVEEQLFTLYFSNWVRRLWTLQEALLSKKLFIHLDDGFIDVLSFLEMDNRVQIPAFFELYRWFQKLMSVPIARHRKENREFSLDDVILHLAHRTSSKPEDEILAIAGLFGLDVRKYVNLDPEERMIQFLMEHNNGLVRFDVLFLQGPKLLVEGFSWAPKTFLNRDLDVIYRGKYEGGWCVISDEGLVGKDYYCLLLKDRWTDQGPPSEYRIRKTDDGEILTIKFDHSIDPDEEENPEYDVLLLRKEVLQGQDDVAGAASLSLSEEREDGTKCLRLDMVGFVRVFNEVRDGASSQVPIANSAKRFEGVVIIS